MHYRLVEASFTLKKICMYVCEMYVIRICHHVLIMYLFLCKISVGTHKCLSRIHADSPLRCPNIILYNQKVVYKQSYVVGVQQFSL